MLSSYQFAFMIVGYFGGHAMKYVFDYFFVKPKPYIVMPRSNWLLWVLNQSLGVPCLLYDRFGINFPKLGEMVHRPLTLEKLMRTAEKRTSLSDWSKNETFPSLFEVAVLQLNEVEASPVGRVISFDYLMRRLETRLRLVEAMKHQPKRPELVREPLIVMGLPRTGTTLMHRLLALDEKARCPKTFELLDPLPKEGRSTAQRVKFWDSKLKLLKRAIPQIEAIHELGAEEPEECLLGMSVEVPLLPPTFRGLTKHCIELLQEGEKLPSMKGAYELYKRQLEFLAADEGGSKRWVLKCPVHLAFTQDLAKVFPDAKLVWMHRDPCESLPSLGSMIRTFADMCQNEAIDLSQIGKEQFAFWSRALRKADADLGKAGAGAKLDRVHVKFDDLTADPVAAVRKIYESFGWTVSPAFEAKMNDYLAESAVKRDAVPANLKKFHEYTLEEYGLDEDQLKEELKGYYSKYL